MLRPIDFSAPSFYIGNAYLSPYLDALQLQLTEILKRVFEAPVGYFLKISVFRQAAMQDPFSQWVVHPLVLHIENIWKRSQGIPLPQSFDPARLEKSAQFLSEFAEVRTLQTSDGKSIRWALYKPEKFQQWITANGGLRIGEWIVPRQPADWKKLKRLGEFKWFEQVGQAFRVPAPVVGAQDKCVLRCQGFGRTMAMDKAFIGMHLAAGFNYSLFDWRDELSVKGYLEDAEGCYQALLGEGFSPSQIKIMASCRGTFPATQLKERHHAEGVDAVLVQPPPSLAKVVANQKPPTDFLGSLGIGAIERDGEHYDSIRRLQGLRPGSGRICLIVSEGDKTLPSDTAEQFQRAAGHAGPFHAIWEPKVKGGIDPHFEEPLRKPEIFKRYAEFLAGRIP